MSLTWDSIPDLDRALALAAARLLRSTGMLILGQPDDVEKHARRAVSTLMLLNVLEIDSEGEVLVKNGIVYGSLLARFVRDGHRVTLLVVSSRIDGTKVES